MLVDANKTWFKSSRFIDSILQASCIGPVGNDVVYPIADLSLEEFVITILHRSILVSLQ